MTNKHLAELLLRLLPVEGISSINQLEPGCVYLNLREDTFRIDRNLEVTQKQGICLNKTSAAWFLELLIKSACKEQKEKLEDLTERGEKAVH